MKIAFIGASGTGKSFLGKQMAASLDLPFQPSFPRGVAEEMGFASPYDVDAAGQRDSFQKRVLARMLAWQFEQKDGFVADRSVFDVLAYTWLHSTPRTFDECADAVALNHRQGALKYDVLFLCPMASFFKLGDDPARNPNINYHVQYEITLKQLVARYPWTHLDISLERVSDIGRQAWLRTVTQLIKGKR